MPLALSSDKGEQNDLNRYINENRKQKRRKCTNDNDADLQEGYGITVFSIKGKRVCKNIFAATFLVHPRTLNTYSKDLLHNNGFFSAENKNCIYRKGKVSIQSQIIIAFLERYSEINALACPTGRGSIREHPVKLLPSNTSKRDVYDIYIKEWQNIVYGIKNEFPEKFKIPNSAVSNDHFGRIWKDKVSWLKIVSKGSDFCDTCTYYRSSIDTALNPQVKHELINSLKIHRDLALQEFKHYKNLMTNAENDEESNRIHIIFDFAEKVLLPYLQKQPGQLHFTTSLKFDLFGIHYSNLKQTFIFGLVEGHWPNAKSGNEVCSMISYFLGLLKTIRNVKYIDMAADNCSGQNKNRFVIWFLCWLIINLDYESIILRFLISGHTKNRCDGAFGLVKKKLKVVMLSCRHK